MTTTEAPKYHLCLLYKAILTTEAGVRMLVEIPAIEAIPVNTPGNLNVDCTILDVLGPPEARAQWLRLTQIT